MIRLSIEDHAESHRVLFETNGKLEDWVAWKALCGQITNAEALMILLKRPKSQETKDKLSESHKRPEIKASFLKRMIGNKYAVGNQSNKGSIWITDGKDNRMVKEEKIPSGWWRGITSDKFGKTNEGTSWITDGIVDKRIKIDEIPDGWGKGRSKAFDEEGNRYLSNVGFVWITNGNESTMLNENIEIPDGWRKGRVLKRCWITHPEKGNKLINNDDISKYLNQGWIRGRIVQLVKKECPHCHNMVDPGNYAQLHGEKCLLNPDESKRRSPIQLPKFKCEHCGMVCSRSMYNRWHGDQCKRKFIDTLSLSSTL